MLFSS